MAASVLDTRIISGKGLIYLPDTDDVKKCKLLTLQVEVMRKASSEYENRNYNPPLGLHATIVALRQEVVMATYKVEFVKQFWDFAPEIAVQNLYAVQCAYEGTLISIANLGTALGLTVTSIEDKIKLWKHSLLFPDEFRFKCVGDSALRVQLLSLPYDQCPAQEANPPNPPPPPPPPPKPPLEPPTLPDGTYYPPGTPLTDTPTPVSPPYDGSSDSDNTDPYPGDSGDDSPPPEFNCDPWEVTIQYKASDTPVSETLTCRVYAEPLSAGSTANVVWVEAGGYIGPLTDYAISCSPPYRQIRVNQGASSVSYSGVSIVSKHKL